MTKIAIHTHDAGKNPIGGKWHIFEIYTGENPLGPRGGSSGTLADRELARLRRSFREKISAEGRLKALNYAIELAKAEGLTFVGRIVPPATGEVSSPPVTAPPPADANRVWKTGSLFSRRAVMQAMIECDRLGREQFLAKYGFGIAREYVVRHNGVDYDSKAIFAVAHKYQPESAVPLASEISGGRAGAAGYLAKLGFDVEGMPRAATDWSASEVKAIVSDYLSMLSAELAGKDFNKAAHNEQLRRSLSNRTKSSVELKHQNISAILQEMGLPRIKGYLPRGHTQVLLRAELTDQLDQLGDALIVPPGETASAQPGAIVPRPDPTLIVASPRARVGIRIDYSARENSNRDLGRKGEEWVCSLLRNMIGAKSSSGDTDRVRWVSKDVGDGLGYDIEWTMPDGSIEYVEVKTTNGSINAPFLVTANEVSVSEELGDSYAIYRVFDFAREPKVYISKGSISATCQMIPRVWQALPLPSREDQ